MTPSGRQVEQDPEHDGDDREVVPEHGERAEAGGYPTAASAYFTSG